MTFSLSPRRERWLLLTLAGIQFTHILDFMIMMPLGPQFTRIFGISNAQFGLLVSAYTLSAGLSGLLASVGIDRFGRKRLLLWLYGLFGLATLACGLAPTYGWLMAARIAAGVFGGVLSALSQTVVADVVPFERRGVAMGVVMTSFAVSTVAGVPLGLFLAAHWSWHMPFLAIAAFVGLLWLFIWQTFPVLDAHVHHHQDRSAWSGIAQVLADRGHWHAFALTGTMMLAGFLVIPYITIYLQSNSGILAEQVPWVYLCGGVATLLTGRWIGRLSDRLGKERVYRRMAWLLPLPLMASTLSEGLPFWALLLISTSLFTVMSGRMIPGMALIASAAQPRLRGTFLSLNSAVQSAAMGVAAFTGGLIIGRDAQGHLTHYWVAGLMGSILSLVTLWLVSRVRVHMADKPSP